MNEKLADMSMQSNPRQAAKRTQNYADIVLTAQGPLTRLWLAAYWDKRLGKNVIVGTDIEEAVRSVQASLSGLTLRTTGQLLLGVATIHARKTVYLLHDCHEAVLVLTPATVKSTRVHSAVNNSAKKSSSNNLSNVSRHEDITIKPPTELSVDTASMLMREFGGFDDDFLEIETMRAPLEEVSYEVARDASVRVPTDLSDLMDATGQSLRADDNREQSALSNTLNMDEYTAPHDVTGNPLNEFSIGGSSINISELRSTNKTLFKMERLQNVVLDPLIDSGTTSSAGGGGKGRKRKFIIDPVMAMTEDEVRQQMCNFQDTLRISSSSDQPPPQKENVPPMDFESPISTNTVPLLTLKSMMNISRPLAARCANLLASRSGHTPQELSFENTFPNNTTEELFHNEVQDTYHGEEDVTIGSHLENQFSSTGWIKQSLKDSLDESLQKYDCGGTLWSQTTSYLAKQINSQLQDDSLSFHEFIKTQSNSDRRSVVNQFYSLLILQREGVFVLHQSEPFDDIIVVET